MAQKIKYLTQDEVRKFLTKIDSRRDKALFKMMYDFGLRISEVGKLTIRDIDFDRGRIWIERLKGGVSGEYAIFRDTLKLIKLYLEERNSDLYSCLFLSRKKNPLSKRRIDWLFKHYAKKAKLPPEKHHAHTLRHSIAVHMLDAGQVQEAVKDRLGHKSIKSTDIYATISTHKRDVIGREMERAREIVRL